MVVFIKHVEIEGPGLFLGFLKEFGFKTAIIDLSKGESLPDVGLCQAIIVLGGPMNVYETDKYSFLSREEKFLKDALSKEIPILGICLGAQILAKVGGAQIKKSPLREIGWYEVRLTDDGKEDILFNGLGDKLSVFQWHEDTFDIPKEAKLLAKGDICKNQALVIGKCAWGLQFHPEMNKRMLKSWLEYYNEDIDRDKVLFNYFERQDIYMLQAKRICLNFSSIIEKVAGIKI